MKKLFLFGMMCLMGMSGSAQNIQFHYDFGRNIYTGEEAGRQKVTVTLEQFKADKWGSWYYFVDVDMSRHFTESAYTEISREVNLGKELPFAAHVVYDGGLSRTMSFQQAALVGAAYTAIQPTSRRRGRCSCCISSTSRATTTPTRMPVPS